MYTKICRGPCHSEPTEISVDNFWPRRYKNGRVGLMPQCKRCSALRQKKWVKDVHAGTASLGLTDYLSVRREATIRSHNGMSPEKRLWKMAKARAKQANIEFGIGEADIEIPSHCPILGLELDRESAGKIYRDNTHSHNLPSIDRIDSSLGYVTGNITVISWRANKLKNNATYSEMVALGDYARQKLNRGC